MMSSETLCRCSKVAMCQGTAPESLPKTPEGGVMSDLTTLTLLNNSTTYTQCPDGYKPRPGDVPYPRPNSVLEEALAVSLMLIFFTFGALLPSVLVMCVVAVSLFGSIPAAAFLGITAADCLLPAGKVCHWLSCCITLLVEPASN